MPIRGLDKKARTHIITAVGLPSISDGIADIKVEGITSHLQLRRADIHRDNGPIDQLVGIDHPKFHGGETREGGTFTARKSPLGWVIFGADSSVKTHHWTVMHAKLASPVNLRDNGNSVQ